MVLLREDGWEGDADQARKVVPRQRDASRFAPDILTHRLALASRGQKHIGARRFAHYLASYFSNVHLSCEAAPLIAQW